MQGPFAPQGAGRPAGPGRTSPEEAFMTSAAFAGAVDLSSLAQRPSDTPAAPAGGDGAAAAARAGGAVIDVTDATFGAEVVERSKQVPVLVDLWAEWCGPCKQLSPLLERLAVESDGAWILAKMDVDANPQVSGQLQVQSIPTVIAAIGGKLMQGFSGALPEDQIRQFIDAVLQAAASAGIGEGPAAPPSNPKLDEAEQALQGGNLAAAEAAFNEVLATSPADPVAKSGLAMVRLLSRVQGLDMDMAVRAADESPDDVTRTLMAADVLLARGQAEAALARLVDAVRRFRGDDRERVRDHFVELVSMLAPDDPMVLKARKDLANALF